jgi:hypothetical protein
MPKEKPMSDRPSLELRVLKMCEELLPKTSERSNETLKALLKDMRKKLEGK